MVLLIDELCLIFLAAPLAAWGSPIGETLVLAILAIVVTLSHRCGANTIYIDGGYHILG
jgi:hypothetical protein